MASQRTISSYGSWKSPISGESIVKESIGLSGISLDGNSLYWVEARAQEKGRNAIVRLEDEKFVEILPKEFNARSTVHEYGGGAFGISQGTVYFSNFQDQRLYRILPGKAPEPITQLEKMRYADFAIDPNGHFLICVREDHTQQGEPTNTLVRIDLDHKGKEEIIAQGYNFYSTPRISPDGKKIVWLAWNHPNMPWDETELWISSFSSDGYLKENASLIAGGNQVSIFQPEWSESGDLYFVSDKTNWWNLYVWRKGEIFPLLPKEAEFGLPQWVFQARTYAPIPKSQKVAFTYNQHGVWHLGILDTKTRKTYLYDLPYTTISGLIASQDSLYFVAGAPTQPSALIAFNLSLEKCHVIKWSRKIEFDAHYLSTPTNIAFTTENGKTAFAWYYPPKNDDFQAPKGELPPLLVKTHGGPTAQVYSDLKLAIQYWTSRGFAVLDVNYGGSTGYGREYRNRLKGNWGVVDLDDCCNAAKHLVKQQLADPRRLAIDGGSAGGYTTLSVLAFRDIFSAGASYYGVSDLEALVRDTHKFEAHYLDGLIGPYPERKDLYVQRSPIHHVDKLKCPIILLQGLEDKVIPPNQSETLFKALKRKGIPTAYITFEHEQHGFRIAENIVKALEAEYYFFSQMFRFPTADALPLIPIEGLHPKGAIR